MNRWLVSSSVMLLGGIRLMLGRKSSRRDLLERLVHRHVDARVGHHLAEVVDAAGRRSSGASVTVLSPRRGTVTRGFDAPRRRCWSAQPDRGSPSTGTCPGRRGWRRRARTSRAAPSLNRAAVALSLAAGGRGRAGAGAGRARSRGSPAGWRPQLDSGRSRRSPVAGRSAWRAAASRRSASADQHEPARPVQPRAGRAEQAQRDAASRHGQRDEQPRQPRERA